MASGVGSFDLVKASNYLKVKYGRAGLILYNSRYPLIGMLKKSTDFNAEYFEEPYEFSLGQGVGWGDTKPQASNEKVEKVRFTSKNGMVRAKIARKLMKLAKGGETAFIDAYKHKWQRTQQAYPLMLEIILSGPKDGSLGTIDALVTNSDPTFVVSITAATWNLYRWHVGWLVNVASGTDVFEVTAVDPANKRLTLRRFAGSQIPATTEKIYFQNSKDNMILPVSAITQATVGTDTLYNILTQHMWDPYQNLSAGTTLDEEMIDDMVLSIEAKTGEAPDIHFTSIKQWKILKSDNVGLKRIMVDNPNVPKEFKARLGFTALEYCSPANSKVVPIMYNRFWADDRYTALNGERCKLKQTSDPEWFDEDGSVFLRTPDNKTDYEATWGNYLENYMPPPYCGEIGGLS